MVPKYVFEQSVTLPGDDSLTVLECHALSSVLAAELGRWMSLMHHERHKVGYEPPFEHVAGDWSPPDENGHLHPTGARPIDL
jgi:hypothetical protein